jgi:hypothetical protein
MSRQVLNGSFEMNESAQTQTLNDPSGIEPVIAGTLMLMTHYPERRCVCIAQKIEHNLELLAGCPHLTPTFRGLCERLRRQWSDTQQVAQQGIAEIIELQRQNASIH